MHHCVAIISCLSSGCLGIPRPNTLMQTLRAGHAAQTAYHAAAVLPCDRSRCLPPPDNGLACSQHSLIGQLCWCELCRLVTHSIRGCQQAAAWGTRPAEAQDTAAGQQGAAQLELTFTGTFVPRHKLPHAAGPTDPTNHTSTTASML